MTSMPASHTNDHEHVLPLSLFLKVFGGLLLLTVLTVGASRLDFGSMNFPMAMLIATIKAGLVALYFMHLRFDNKFYLVILLGSLLYVFVFFFPTMLDMLTRGLEDPAGALRFPPPLPGHLPTSGM